MEIVLVPGWTSGSLQVLALQAQKMVPVGGNGGDKQQLKTQSRGVQVLADKVAEPVLACDTRTCKFQGPLPPLLGTLLSAPFSHWFGPYFPLELLLSCECWCCVVL